MLSAVGRSWAALPMDTGSEAAGVVEATQVLHSQVQSRFPLTLRISGDTF